MAWTAPQNSDGFWDVKLPGRIAVCIESSRVEECLTDARGRGATDVVLAPLMGFSGVDSEFLRGQTWIKGISIVNIAQLDLGGIESIADTLEYFATGDLRQPLKRSDFPRLAEFRWALAS